MTEFTIDWPHGHQTRDGRPARIICTDLKGGDLTVAAAIMGDGDLESILRFRADGKALRSNAETDADLINKPAPMPAVWLNVYGNTISGEHESKADADASADDDRIACRAVQFRDGKVIDVTDEMEGK